MRFPMTKNPELISYMSPGIDANFYYKKACFRIQQFSECGGRG